MTAAETSAWLDRMLHAIGEAADRLVGVNSYEHLLRELLEFLVSDRVDRPTAVAMLSRLAEEWPSGSPEVLEFTMHELRWPEVRSALENHREQGGDFRTRDLAAQVLEAFEDDWPAGEIYERYRPSET